MRPSALVHAGAAKLDARVGAMEANCGCYSARAFGPACELHWQTLVAPHAVVVQTDPAQHALLVAPQATQRFVPVWQTKGSPQYPPLPRFGGQQGCPEPPHATHVPFEHVLDGAVQLTPPPQQGAPSRPHAPL